jgi:curved DNA-binding protein CbpA
MQPQLFPYAPERDVYRLLQVQPSADQAEITAAVRRLARAFHPDRNRSPYATQEMQVVNAVRNLLVDPQARAVYDRARQRYFVDGAALSGRRVTRLVSRPAEPRVVSVPRPASAHRSAPAVPAVVDRGRATSVRAVVALTGDALLAALRALIDAFRPRCAICSALADFDHRYCASCGAPLGRPRPLTSR